MLVEPKPRILAVIPARAGSKRLPKKNILPLAKIPLVGYSIKAALDCPSITDVILSSESEEICELGKQDAIKVILRPHSLAEDNIPNEYVVEHAILEFTKTAGLPDYLVLLQPTSPLRTAEHLENCLKAFLNSKLRSVISVCETEHHPAKYLRIQKGEVKPYTCLEDVEKQSQLLEPIYRQNGAIYSLKTQDFLQTLKFYQPPCLPFIMSKEDSIDIDTLDDLNFCEFLLQKKSKRNNYAL